MKNLLFGFTLLFSLVLFAQTNENNDYWNSWRYTPKQGMTAEFEAAVAKKMKTFNSTPETAIMTYKVVTGRNSGTYERVEGMKYPKHYNMDRSAEGEYWQKNVAKFVENNSGQMRWDRLNNLTLNWDQDNPGKPSKYLEKKTFDVKPDGRMHFRRFMNRTTQIMKKRGYLKTQLVFRCISGGSDNTFIRVRGWNDYEDNSYDESSENSSSFRDDYDQEYGWGSFNEDLTSYQNSIQIFGELTETLELVPSLSTVTN
jgi:hypothetical protein